MKLRKRIKMLKKLGKYEGILLIRSFKVQRMIMMNSFFGKFGQSELLKEKKIYYQDNDSIFIGEK